MSGKMAFYSPINVIALTIVLSIYLVVVSIAAALGGVWGVVIASALYLSYSKISRARMLRHQKRGMKLLGQERYDEAIDEFRCCYEYLTRHAWIDQYRMFTMLSHGALSYREICLCNIAYAYLQAGELQKAIDQYHRVLEVFPDSVIATSSLNNIEKVVGAVNQQRQNAVKMDETSEEASPAEIA